MSHYNFKHSYKHTNTHSHIATSDDKNFAAAAADVRRTLIVRSVANYVVNIAAQKSLRAIVMLCSTRALLGRFAGPSNYQVHGCRAFTHACVLRWYVFLAASSALELRGASRNASPMVNQRGAKYYSFTFHLFYCVSQQYERL